MIPAMKQGYQEPDMAGGRGEGGQGRGRGTKNILAEH